MFLNLLQLFRGDKQIDHPILGQLSCKSLQEAYKNCMGFIDQDQDQQKQCKPYYNLSVQCFQTKDEEEFSQFLDEKIEERRKLLTFLKLNNSQIPEMQRNNQQQFFNLFTAIDEEVMNEQQVKNFYQQQQEQNKKYM